MPIDHYVIPAFCPITSGRRDLKLEKAFLLRILKDGPTKMYYELRVRETADYEESSVYEILNNPAAVFDGLRRF